MKRRSFIKLGLSTGVSASIYNINVFGLNLSDNIKIAHLADLHIGEGDSQINSNYLRTAINDINSKSVDATIICGDLLHMMAIKYTSEFKSILSELNSPYYYVPGNHDVGMIPSINTLNQYRKLFGEDYFKFEIKEWLFIGVNSQLWQGGPSSEQKKQSDWLLESLTFGNKNNKRIIVFGHMPLFLNNFNENFSVNNNVSLNMRSDLCSLFKEKNVIAYLHGHLHRHNSLLYNGIQLVSTRTVGNRPLGVKKNRGFKIWNMVENSSTQYGYVTYSDDQ